MLVLQVVLPLVNGTDVMCKWRDGGWYKARVIERRKLPDSDEHEYYMHYMKCEHLASLGFGHNPWSEHPTFW